MQTKELEKLAEGNRAVDLEKVQQVVRQQQLLTRLGVVRKRSSYKIAHPLTRTSSGEAPSLVRGQGK